MPRRIPDPENYPGSIRMIERSTRRSGCSCPQGSRRLTTSRGRGFVCQGGKKLIVKKRGRTWVIKKPFVKAICR